MRELAASALWILGGASLTAGLFWAFLNTPESTVFTLALSLLLGLAMYVVLAATTCGLMVGWAHGWRQPVMRRAMRGVLTFLPLLILVVAMWWIVGRGLDWVGARSGEISAWFIATFDWSNATPLLTGVRRTGEWFRWVAVPFAALVWLGEALAGRWRPVAGHTWRAGALVRLALVTVVAAMTLWAPMTYGVAWMPRGLPPTWVEPAVALAKFGLMAVVGAVGLSLVARLAVR